MISDFAMPLPVAVISEMLGEPEPDRTRDDLVSALTMDEAGDRLDEAELMAMIAILLSAGHGTTTNLTGNGALALIEHPEARERLRTEPELMSSAVEELLRFCGPVEMSTPRYAREQIVIGGASIAAGSVVFGVIVSAHCDECQFAGPSRLDLGRRSNRHLTFGEGGHYCVTAALARLEAAIAFRALLARVPKLRLAHPREKPRWQKGLILRGLKQLSIEHAG